MAIGNRMAAECLGHILAGIRRLRQCGAGCRLSRKWASGCMVSLLLRIDRSHHGLRHRAYLGMPFESGSLCGLVGRKKISCF